MAKQGFFKTESQKEEFLLLVAISFWFISLAPMVLSIPFMSDITSHDDAHYWFTLQDPGGGSLSYPVLCISYLKFLHFLSGENEILFTQIAASASLLFLVSIVLLLSRMGINNRKLVILSLLLQPALYVAVLRIEVIPIFLSLAAAWLFYSGKRAEGWLALLAGGFFKVFPLFFAPLFLAMELKDFNRKSAIRLISVGIIALLAFSIFPDNLRTVIFSSARGIQLESTYSSAILALNSIISLGVGVEYNYGSYQLTLPPSFDSLPALALILQAGSVLALSALFFLEGAKKDKFFTYLFLVAASMILFSKVFSAQFILWPLVFAIPVFAIPWKSPKIKGNLLPTAVLYVSAIFSFVVYPLLWLQLIFMGPVAIEALALRNLLLILVFAWVLLNRDKFYLKTDSK